MTIFWLVAGLFMLGALLFLLPGLLRPAAARAAAPEADLAASGAAPAPGRPSRRTALALALLLPAGSVLTYLQLGAPAAMSGAPAAVAEASAAPHATSPEQISRMAGVLAERLQARPDDTEGWLMLGRSYLRLGRYPDAAAALRRAAEIGPPSATLLADLADVTGMAQGRRLAGEPARLVQQALDLDPRHPKALALAGSVAFETRDYGAARSYWERLAAVVPPGSEMARSVQVNIAQATQLEGGLQPVAARADGVAQLAPAAAPQAATAVSGRVELSPELAARLPTGATLFIFARAAQGPRMPLAIQRLPATAQTVNFTLDDSMAMAPALRISAFPQVVVGARISASGSATPQPGDLVGQSEPVAPGSRGVHVLISALQP